MTTLRATDEWPGLGATLIRARVAIRHAGAGDADFVRQLHHVGRAAEIAPLCWPPALASQFLDDQFRLRDTHYRANHPTADQFIITRDAASIGQIFIDRSPRTWRLIDIALAPEIQGLGFGGALIKWLQRWAQRNDADGIDLHVLLGNDRAAALYRRHGFADAGNHSATTHKRLIWRIG